MTTATPSSVAVAMLLALGLFGCDALPGKAKAREAPASPDVSFPALYRGQCAGCHGADGRLGAARPLNDPVYLALVPAQQLRQVIAEGVSGTMQPAL